MSSGVGVLREEEKMNWWGLVELGRGEGRRKSEDWGKKGVRGKYRKWERMVML